MKPHLIVTSLLVVALILLGIGYRAGEAQEPGIIITDADVTREVDSSVAPPDSKLDTRISMMQADSLRFVTLRVSSTLNHIPVENLVRFIFHGLDAKRELGLSTPGDISETLEPRIIFHGADGQSVINLAAPGIISAHDTVISSPTPSKDAAAAIIAATPTETRLPPGNTPVSEPAAENTQAFNNRLKSEWWIYGLVMAAAGTGIISASRVIRSRRTHRIRLEKPEHNIGKIRKLLLTAFTPDDLKRFCLDRPTFRPVCDEFGPGQGLKEIVDKVIIYCRTNSLFDELLAEVKETNPRQYERNEPYSE